MSKLEARPGNSTQALKPSAEVKKATDKPQAASEASRAIPVSMLSFSSPVVIPGRSGAANQIVVGKPTGTWNSAIYVDTIFLYGGEFIVDGTFFVPKTAGALLGWKF